MALYVLIPLLLYASVHGLRKKMPPTQSIDEWAKSTGIQMTQAERELFVREIEVAQSLHLVQWFAWLSPLFVYGLPSASRMLVHGLG